MVSNMTGSLILHIGIANSYSRDALGIMIEGPLLTRQLQEVKSRWIILPVGTLLSM